MHVKKDIWLKGCAWNMGRDSFPQGLIHFPQVFYHSELQGERVATDVLVNC